MTRIERYRQEVYRRYGLTCPPRWATLRDLRRPTLGGKVARIAAALGTPLMPWQRYVVDTALEVDPATRVFCYRSVGVTVPRQSGKTTQLLAVACHRAQAWQRQRILYAAQTGLAAREKLEDDQIPALVQAGWAPAEDERLLPHHRAKIRRASGRMAIVWRRTGSIHGLHSSAQTSGHGKTLNLGLLDELFAQIDYRIWAAWRPAMITDQNAQSWWWSTAGTARSVPLNAARERGQELVQAGVRSRVAYFDWSDDPANDRGDRSQWARYMPALCPTPGPCSCSPRWRHTITMEGVETELAEATTPQERAEYDRAYRNLTREDDELGADPNVPTVEAWRLLKHADAKPSELLALGIDAYNGWAAIVAVGPPVGADDRRLLFVLEHGPGDQWVVQKAAALQEQLKPVAWAIDEKAAAGKLVQRLEAAGITRMARGEPHRGGLWVPTVTQLSAADGAFGDAVDADRLMHRGQEQMEQALAATRTRPVGDGAYAYGRRQSTDDITPVRAGSLALDACERFAHLVHAGRSIYETRGLTVLGDDEEA